MEVCKADAACNRDGNTSVLAGGYCQSCMFCIEFVQCFPNRSVRAHTNRAR